jgi:hypothetical protein
MNWDLFFTIIGVGVALSIAFSMLGIVYTVIVAMKFESIVKVAKKYNSEPDFFAEFAKLDKLDKEQE